MLKKSEGPQQSPSGGLRPWQAKRAVSGKHVLCRQCYRPIGDALAMKLKKLKNIFFEGLTIIAGSDDPGMPLNDIIALREALADASEAAWARAN